MTARCRPLSSLRLINCRGKITAAGGGGVEGRGGNRTVNKGAPEELELCPSSYTQHLSPGFPAIVL